MWRRFPVRTGAGRRILGPLRNSAALWGDGCEPPRARALVADLTLKTGASPPGEAVVSPL